MFGNLVHRSSLIISTRNYITHNTLRLIRRLSLYGLGRVGRFTTDSQLQSCLFRRASICPQLFNADGGYRSRTEMRPNSFRFNYALTGLLIGSLLIEDQNPSPNASEFPLKVSCAETTRPQIPKERLASIQALDVVADVAEDVQPGVVSILSTDKMFLAHQSRSSGSGFVIDDAGHVITNAHVVGYRGDVSIHMSDGRVLPGKVLAVDVSSDLALIRLDVNPKAAKALPYIPLASNLKAIRPGNFVLALGSPLMLANTVTVGVVSAVDRDLGHSEGLKYIQTDAIITFGNSGGPLVNLYGEVIGVNTMIAGTGVGFAIPVDQVRKFVQLALEAASNKGSPKMTMPTSSGDSSILSGPSTRDPNQPKRRYLGLVMRTLTPELAFELASRGVLHYLEISEGVLIHAVLRGSPAQRAGLQAGDVIIAIDGQPITNAQQVYTATENREELSIVIIRAGKKITINNVRTEKV